MRAVLVLFAVFAAVFAAVFVAVVALFAANRAEPAVFALEGDRPSVPVLRRLAVIAVRAVRAAKGPGLGLAMLLSLLKAWLML